MCGATDDDALWDLSDAIQGQQADDPRCSWTALITGTGHRPYVSRILVPSVVRALDTVSPSWLRATLDGPAKHIANQLGGPAEHAFELAIALAVVMSCFIGLVFVLVALVTVKSSVSSTTPFPSRSC